MDLGKLAELSEKRICKDCGAEFARIPASKDAREVSALEQFSDHLVVHQPTAEQWKVAYDKIQSFRSRSARS